MALRYLIRLLPILLAGCSGGSPVAPSPSSASPRFEVQSSAHFAVHHTSIDAASVATIADRLEAQYPRVIADLGVTEMPVVEVFLYPDRASFTSAVTPIIGPLPAFASGAISGSSRVHILSPNLASVWPFNEGIVNITHEVAHCVSMAINPTIPNNPRWLWESVAIFEAGQFVDPRGVTELRAPQSLTLSALNGFDTTAIYRVGYVMAEFIVVEWGRSGLIALLQANGDLTRTFQISEPAFLERWRTFLHDRYGVG